MPDAFGPADTDGDNDGLPDAVEDGDFDRDGIADYLQRDSGLETAVTGSGASMNILTLILLSALALARGRGRGRRALALLPALLILGLILRGGPAQAAEPCRPDAGASRAACWYLGLGAGLTHVEPEGESNGWRTSDSSSRGFKLFAGYWLRDPELPLNAYAKAGLSLIRNDSTETSVDYDRQTAAQLAVGVGVQLRMTQRWFARLELDSYDRDARYLNLSIGAYLGR